MTIRQLRNQDADFYLTLGPFLSRRAIVKEQGAPIWDDDAKIWFMAEDKGVVLGFAALIVRGTRAEITSLYVRPIARRRGVGRRLLQEILRITPDAVSTFQAMATAMSRPAFVELGFRICRRHGQFGAVEYRRA
jgi:ribosomal protein S18 acetylase RimI-like enzyme